MRPFLIALLAALLPFSALANDFEPIKDRDEFLSLVGDKNLRIGLYNLTLKVTPDGQISGKAMGWDITGAWDWKGGYFCRQMDWSGKEIDYNCQLVEKRGESELRFTSDKGAGQRATFRLR
ncbi:dihydrodipicolinate reductase [Thioclava sp. FR2]|uniref:dihydrodipicolinate reductase n=1 Tax=Thioclava sp. FR2 TaxID=3445780 RepID=UPI003EBFC238